MMLISLFQISAASICFTMAWLHVLVWLRGDRVNASHLLFAGTAFAGGGTAIAETLVYRATSIDQMGHAMQVYVGWSGLWILVMIWFIVHYAKPGPIASTIAKCITIVTLWALVVNAFSPSSFLFSEITSLRTANLPWDETIQLAEGRNRVSRFLCELSQPACLVLVIVGAVSIARRECRRRGWVIGGSLATFFLLFGGHAMLVETGIIDSPYLTTYGFLLVMFVLSFDLAGEVARATFLSKKLALREAEKKNAILEERHRIAGDLHDSVMQSLFTVNAIADAVPGIWKRHPEEALSGLSELRGLTQSAIGELRTLVLELRPERLAEFDLHALLEQTAASISRRTGLDVVTHIGRVTQALPVEVKVVFFRVAQEALNNVGKHAGVNSAELRLHVEGGKLCLEVIDRGQGFDLRSIGPDHFGLEVMEERVHSIGGTVHIDSRVGSGTRIRVSWAGGANDLRTAG